MPLLSTTGGPQPAPNMQDPRLTIARRNTLAGNEPSKATRQDHKDLRSAALVAQWQFYVWLDWPGRQALPIEYVSLALYTLSLDAMFDAQPEAMGFRKAVQAMKDAGMEVH